MTPPSTPATCLMLIGRFWLPCSLKPNRVGVHARLSYAGFSTDSSISSARGVPGVPFLENMDPGQPFTIIIADGDEMGPGNGFIDAYVNASVCEPDEKVLPARRLSIANPLKRRNKVGHMALMEPRR